MTFFVKCDTCGKVQEADDQGHFPGNPIDNETKQKWWSRVKNNKHEHACCKAHLKEGLVWPEWAV